MTKYAKYYQQMWSEHTNLLTAFASVHDAYKSNQKEGSIKRQFDIKGKEVRQVLEEWDRRLCQKMEKGKNGVFSSKVSEKFWSEVKKDFPLIDLVGVEVSFSH